MKLKTDSSIKIDAVYKHLAALIKKKNEDKLIILEMRCYITSLYRSSVGRH